MQNAWGLPSCVDSALPVLTAREDAAAVPTTLCLPVPPSSLIVRYLPSTIYCIDYTLKGKQGKLFRLATEDFIIEPLDNKW